MPLPCSLLMKRDFFRRAASVLRDLWLMVGITLLILVALELIARGVFYVRDVATNGSFEFVDESLRADVYRGQDWAAGYWREEARTVQTTRSDWHPYVYFRRSPFHGDYINVDQKGVRATWNETPAPSPTQIKITVLGGSALWGTGARDDFTIPSALSKKLAANNIDTFVTNLGEGGYVSTQELLTLLLELRQGNVPDVVIFYDGANDIFSAFQQGVAGIPQNEYNRAAEFNQINWRGAVLEKLSLYRAFAGLIARTRPPRTDQANVALANDVLDVYAANLRIVESLAKTYGFTVAYFWQPTIYNKKNLSVWEKGQINRYGEAQFFQQSDQLLKQRNLSDVYPNFHELTNIFGDDPNTVFIDLFHISEAGNDRVAEQIMQTLSLSPRLKTQLEKNR